MIPIPPCAATAPASPERLIPTPIPPCITGIFAVRSYVKAAVEAGVDLIISGAGLPMNLPALVQNVKTKLLPIVSSVKSVQVIMKYWMKKYRRLPDAVVVEGPLAGGHLGFSKEQLSDIDNLHYDEEVGKIIQTVNETAKENNTDIPVISSAR